MSYTFSKIVDYPFDKTIAKITEDLKQEQLGVVTTIDMSKTLKEKTGVAIQKYHILGVCSPSFALKAVQAENEIGVMLPCNIVVQSTKDGKVKVSAIDPVASLMAVDNKELVEASGVEVGTKLKRVIDEL